MGFTAMQRIASTLGWSYDADPMPDAPLQLTYEEFEYAVEVLVATGFPMERSVAEAWPHFQGWRVNYEAIAYRLADRVVAPRAPWSGDRRHLSEALQTPMRPPHRSPEGRVIEESKFRPDAHRPASSTPSGLRHSKKLRSGPSWRPVGDALPGSGTPEAPREPSEAAPPAEPGTLPESGTPGTPRTPAEPGTAGADEPASAGQTGLPLPPPVA